MNFLREKKGQVTLFIILAIVIVVGVLLYFALDISFGKSLPQDMQPVYDYYISYLEDVTEQGILILGQQGGYIEIPDFEAGSIYSPTSSELDFFGQSVPYWLYLSGNNVLKEQVPTKEDMEEALANYVRERLQDCDFTDYIDGGFGVYVDEGEVSVTINDNLVSVEADNLVTIYKEDDSAIVSSNEFEVSSKLGKYYELAVEVYETEMSDMFFENYALDVMYNYAPVTGVETTCSPVVFSESEIIENITEALVVNMNSIKFDGDYYQLSSGTSEYFVVDLEEEVNENVNVMYSSSWPTRIDVYGDLINEPIGVQEGLSVLGFCYVPYHLVYDITFPVLIQFYDNEFLFQFPMNVIVDNSQAREAVEVNYTGTSLEDEICANANADITIYTYDSELNPVEAAVTFKCFDSVCELGSTEIVGNDAVYSGEVPACMNGFVVATAEGYAQTKTQVSTNSENVANVFMKKKYTLDLEMDDVDGTASVSFVSDEYSTTVVYPETDTVELVEGNYNITVYVYDDSSLTFEGATDTICVDVPVTGIGGVVGLTEEQCYEVDMSEMEITSAVVGGGMSSEYIAESMLRNNEKLNVYPTLFETPESLDELYENYEAIEDSSVIIDFE